ncbi:MAG: trypsin-like serine protease, partial [Cytophagaceae bacterium]
YKGDFPALKGSSLRLVGYGAAGLSTPGRGSGTKRLVTMRVANVNATKIRFDETGKSACDGDSGGPAFVETSNGQFQLAGVTSCGAVDCKSYGVYTRIDPFMEFLGLTQTADPSLSLPLCGAALNSKICEGDSIVSCQQDCFEPITTKISCASANGGRCTGLRGAARCIDNSYLAQTLVFQKLSYTANEGFKTAPYKALGVFVDNGHPKDSVYGATDDEGVIRVEMTAGDHALKIRRGDRSYTPHALKSFVSKDQSETHSYILGDINLQITVSGGGETAYYITGAGPLFGDWQRARRLNQLGMQWIYEDALAGRSDYKIMEIQSLDSEIAVDPMLWSKAKVQTVPVRAASYPDAWVTVKLKASDL